jgi:hypothetical protein
MFSRILVKLVDEAIIPAIALLAVRILAAILIANQLGIGFEIGASGFVYESASDFLIVNSYSTLSMICVLAVGLFYVLIKSHIFHDSHVEPHMSAKLFTLRLSNFVQTSFDVYSQGAIWLSYSYLLLLASGVMVYFGLLFPWVLWVSVVLTLISTYLLVVDVEKEVVFKRSSGDDNDLVDEVVLSWNEEDLE